MGVLLLSCTSNHLTHKTEINHNVYVAIVDTSQLQMLRNTYIPFYHKLTTSVNVKKSNGSMKSSELIRHRVRSHQFSSITPTSNLPILPTAVLIEHYHYSIYHDKARYLVIVGGIRESKDPPVMLTSRILAAHGGQCHSAVTPLAVSERVFWTWVRFLMDMEEGSEGRRSSAGLG